MRKDEVRRVGPAEAEEFMRRNHPRNRPVNKQALAEFCRIIRDGEWEVTHQGIGFDEDGMMFDGQKRCMAIIATGVTVSVLVTTGVSRSAFKAVDRGQRRDHADQLYMDGHNVDKEDVAGLKAMLCGVGAHHGRVWTLAVLREAWQQHETAWRFCKEYLPKRRMNSVVRAVVARAYYTADRARLIEFCQFLGSGEIASNGDGAALHLAKKMSSRVWSTGAERRELYCLAERALTLYLKYDNVAQLRPVVQEQFPVPGEKEYDESHTCQEKEETERRAQSG